jgi:hypothetical protein
MINIKIKVILPIILAACTVPASGNASLRSVPSSAEVETLSVGFNDETIKGFCLFIDARSGEEKAADLERGYPAGPVIVFFHGHAQRPDDAYEFTSRLALLSKSGMVIIPICDTPYGAKSSFHGDKGKDVILMEMVRFMLAREGMSVRGFVPVTSMPVAVNGLNMGPEENDNTGARIVSIGWSHGGILARRFAHAYPSSVCSLGQVCPAGYEHWGPWGLTGRFALESVRITTKMSGHVGQTFGSAWGFTKGFTGDFFRSITAAAVNLHPAKLLRIFKDIRDCSRYCDSTTLAASHLEHIAVIFGRDDSCMSLERQLGIKDPDNVTEDDLKRFSRTFYSDIKVTPFRLTLRVLPGTHLAPVINNELYSRTILADLGELSGK